jgi:hypothetical protein
MSPHGRCIRIKGNPAPLTAPLEFYIYNIWLPHLPAARPTVVLFTSLPSTELDNTYVQAYIQTPIETHLTKQ